MASEETSSIWVDERQMEAAVTNLTEALKALRAARINGQL